MTEHEETSGESGATARDEDAWPCSVPRGGLIADKYRVESCLGEGGMGVVVSAMHVDLDVRVAIKLMLPGLFRNAESAARFEREARATVRIQSDHVARMHDYGRLPDGSPFIVMELLVGEPLSALLERALPVPTARAVDLLLQACVGVAEAHRLGVIHRDLKPENLFLTTTSERGETLKILDFGIAKATWDGLPTRTEGGMGTPAYAAPEQLRCASDAGTTADIWSLGVVLFELLTGRLPFDAPSLAEMCVAVLTKRPPTLRSLRPDLPAELEGVLACCLEVDPALRYQSAAALARALDPFASDEGSALARRLARRIAERDPSGAELDPPLSRPSSHQPTLADAVSDLSAAREAPHERWSGRRRSALVVVAFAAILLLGGVTSQDRSMSHGSVALALATETTAPAPLPPPSSPPPLPPSPPPSSPALPPPAPAPVSPLPTPLPRPVEDPASSSRPRASPAPSSPRPSRTPLFEGFGGRR